MIENQHVNKAVSITYPNVGEVLSSGEECLNDHVRLNGSAWT